MTRRPAPAQQLLLDGLPAGFAPDLPAACIAGVDEAGRGCLAGPVVAAACILPAEYDLPGLDDSKALSAQKREALALGIRAQALAWAVGLAWPAEIDRINILQASLRSMERAVARLRLRPQFLLIDGNQPCRSAIAQRTVIGGDALVPAISAASILAKTWRDRLLCVLDRRHPGYGLAIHKGYGTAVHLEALRRLGPSPVHRLSFRGVRPPGMPAQSAPGQDPDGQNRASQNPASQNRSEERQQCLPGISTSDA